MNKKKRKRIKLPNGFGSITELSGNRRNPFMIYKTKGWDTHGKQIKEILGYMPTYEDALVFLINYNKNPYDISKDKITVNDVYELLDAKLRESIGKPKNSLSNYKNLKNAYYSHCKEIMNIKIKDLNYIQMQSLIDNCQCKATTKGYIKNVCGKIYEYAKLYLNIDLDLSIISKLEVGVKEQSGMHKPLSNKEINMLWELPTSKEKIISLILLYTGIRPTELINIEINNIYIEDSYMIGGCKTEAGKNRIIPIHNDIKEFVKDYALKNEKYLIENVKGKQTTYKYINKCWNHCMKLLNIKHYPYDSRHTFATKLDEYKINNPNSIIDDYTIKKLMGHSISDVTKGTYTHRETSYLVDAINLLVWKGDE